jgi:hypothetical protein
MNKHGNRKSRAGHPASTSAAGTRANGGLTRRAWIGIALGGAATALVGERWWRKANPAVIAANATPITVYASPSCGCCQKWVDHLRRSGFHVTVENLVDVTPIKRQFGVPESLWSCHTAMVHSYAVEGHVPADLIQKVVGERPPIVGLAVPGMPNGSPGMEGARKDAYEVIAFTRSGVMETYAVR